MGISCGSATSFKLRHCQSAQTVLILMLLKDIATAAAQDWSAWEDCSVTCGGGKQTRTRDVAVPATNGGKACVGNFGLKTHSVVDQRRKSQKT